MVAVFLASSVVSVWPSSVFLAAIAVFWMVARGSWLTGILVAAATITAFNASIPLAPMPPGPIALEGVMRTDVIEGRFGPYALVQVTGFGPVLADLPELVDVWRGDHVHVEGIAAGGPGVIGGRRHHGTVRVDELRLVSGPTSPFTALGNRIRERVAARVGPGDGGRGLLAGFVVGDTDRVDPIDQEAMRRSGLSHFTAVSGSNVALFLTVLFVAVGPIGVGPRRRAVMGLLALPVFAAATRFEPSVLRASMMAALVLGGRLVGVGLETWQVLSAAVVTLVVVDPVLAGSVGFQLSVAATVGVIVGTRWPVTGGPLVRALTVTLGAQVAVGPILVAQFGAVPLLSPLANLVAAPIVTAATVLGMLGTIGPGWLIDIGAWLAGIVLALARVASGWPQVGWGWVLALGATAVLGSRRPGSRPALAAAGSVLIALLVLGTHAPPPEPGAVVLDVGQGDAILLAGGDGQFALIDGGPDPVALIEALRRYGVRQLRLVVLTHAHADHAAGLVGVVGRIPIGIVWADTEPHTTPASEALFDRLADDGVPVAEPRPGDDMALGGLELTVEGPLRRYASPNDQSIVLLVEGSGRTMLLTGDIEAVAQSELEGLRADVLKVPHHGSATSDTSWLVSVDSDIAVISVGDNDFGHPSGDVIRALEESGDEVLRTDLDGDVVVPLG